MTADTHVTAPTRFVEANGIRYAYRRFGAETGTPLVFLQHFRGGLDNWDPLVTDGLAQGRPVILFNNAGVASSSGQTPDTIDAMGDHVAAFVNALGLSQVDVLGFSIGGYVAQAFVLRHPHLVRKMVLVGTGPRNGEPPTDPKILKVAGNPVPDLEDFLFLFFAPSQTSLAAGKAFWERRHQRKDQDPPSSNGPGSSRCDHGMAPTTWRTPCLFEDDQPADPGGQRPQRHHGADRQRLHPVAEHAERSTHRLPRFRARRTFPVPGAFRDPCAVVPGRSVKTQLLRTFFHRYDAPARLVWSGPRFIGGTASCVRP